MARLDGTLSFLAGGDRRIRDQGRTKVGAVAVGGHYGRVESDDLVVDHLVGRPAGGLAGAVVSGSDDAADDVSGVVADVVETVQCPAENPGRWPDRHSPSCTGCRPG